MPDGSQEEPRRIRSVTIKILGREYRVRSDDDPKHLEEVASYVDRVLREVQGSFDSDTQATAILAAMNIASDLVRMRQMVAFDPERIRSLIDLVESA
jgi:cell division protein ZapA (FtsZ GTPase activity inhibitor)